VAAKDFRERAKPPQPPFAKGLAGRSGVWRGAAMLAGRSSVGGAGGAGDVAAAVVAVVAAESLPLLA
jgi:hypothetical protein